MNGIWEMTEIHQHETHCKKQPKNLNYTVMSKLFLLVNLAADGFQNVRDTFIIRRPLLGGTSL